MASWKALAEAQFTTPAEVNLAKVRALLAEKRKEQEKLDKNLQATTSKTKADLSDVLDEAQGRLTDIAAVRSLLEKYQSDLSVYCRNHDIDLEQPSSQQRDSNDAPQATLLRDLKSIEGNINKVENAKDYIKTLLAAFRLHSKAHSLANSDPQAAVETYMQRQRLVQYIHEQPGTHGFVDLVAFLEQSQSQLWSLLNKALTEHMKAVLKTLRWPWVNKPPPVKELQLNLDAFKRAFRDLLLLPDRPNWAATPEASIPQNTPLSRSLSLLLEPLAVRFMYHFEGKEATNSLDNPELYLNYVKKCIANHIDFLVQELQPEVDDACKAFEGERLLVKDTFIEGLLKNVSRKLKKTIPKLLKRHDLLSMTIGETLLFDDELQHGFDYDTKKHGGAATTILENPETFQTWFEAERSFAQTRYEEIMSRENLPYENRDLDKVAGFDSGTKSAIALEHLLEAITESYHLLPLFQQKFAFFNGIQMELLKLYQKDITESAERLAERRSLRLLAIPGTLPEDANEERVYMSTLPKLYGLWSSASRMRAALRRWSINDHFVDMHHELGDGGDGNDGIPFSITLTQFTKLCDRIADLSAKMVAKEWTANARPYLKKESWAQVEHSASPSEISGELYRPLRDFERACHYMSKRLPDIEFLDFYRRLSSELEEWFRRFVIAGNRFSEGGAQQLKYDLDHGLWNKARIWVNRPENFTKRLKHSLTVLTLPSERDAAESDVPTCQDLMTILVHSHPDEAHAALERLGVELTPDEARDVLRQRVGVVSSWN